MKKSLIILAMSLIGLQSWATITFKLIYNPGLDVFEVYFSSTQAYPINAPMGGSQAVLAFDNTYDLTQITISSFIGGTWSKADAVTGNIVGSLNDRKVQTFANTGAPVAGATVANTDYKLFSFAFSAGQNCNGAKTLRLFVNTIDPTDPNGSGGDFTSFLDLGGTQWVSTNVDPTFKTCALLTPLPVRFSLFTAVKKDKDGLLNWITENQDLLASHFEIERSLNGIDFINIGRIDATAALNGSGNYSYYDRNVASLRSSGPVYYRIKQVDKDGKFVYTEIRSIRFDSKTGIALYPNPAKSFSSLTVELPEDGAISVRVSDATGKELQKYEISGFKGVNLQRIDLTKFAAGSYVVRVKTGDMTQTIALIKSE